MEMLIFLNGMLAAVNVLLLWKVRKQRTTKTERAEPDREENAFGKPTKEKQWEDFLSYDGNVGVNQNGD